MVSSIHPMCSFSTGSHLKALGDNPPSIHESNGLFLSPAVKDLPSVLKTAVEFLPRRLYWVTLNNYELRDISNITLFNTDNEYVYNAFFADFGPLNLGITIRYCRKLAEMLRSSALQSQVIVHTTAANDYSRANAAYLMAAFCVVVLDWDPTQACEPFESISPPLLPYRDATYGACSYRLRILDCCAGLKKALSLGWFSLEKFDVESYEFYERQENGDITWIIPNRFVALSGPEERRSEDGEFIPFTPEECIPILTKLASCITAHTISNQGVKLVVRLNNRLYDRKLFLANRIDHVDLFFADGSCPSRDLVKKFLWTVDKQDGVIAVHCKAGLGRTGTLIGCYAIRSYGFTGRAWIGWNRICRPGSVLGPQQYFLSEVEPMVHRSVPANRTKGNCSDLSQLLQLDAFNTEYGKRSLCNVELLFQEMNLDDKLISEIGDSGQGTRLVNAKRQSKLWSVACTPTSIQSMYNLFFTSTIEVDNNETSVTNLEVELTPPPSGQRLRSAQPEDNKGIKLASNKCIAFQ